MVISSTDKQKVVAKSPFKINRELVRILSHGVTKQRSGDLIEDLRYEDQMNKLERVFSVFFISL